MSWKQKQMFDNCVGIFWYFLDNLFSVHLILLHLSSRSINQFLSNFSKLRNILYWILELFCWLRKTTNIFFSSCLGLNHRETLEYNSIAIQCLETKFKVEANKIQFLNKESLRHLSSKDILAQAMRSKQEKWQKKCRNFDKKKCRNLVTN